jgi:uncharacterized membrane protein
MTMRTLIERVVDWALITSADGAALAALAAAAPMVALINVLLAAILAFFRGNSVASREAMRSARANPKVSTDTIV